MIIPTLDAIDPNWREASQAKEFLPELIAKLDANIAETTAAIQSLTDWGPGIMTTELFDRLLPQVIPARGRAKASYNTTRRRN